MDIFKSEIEGALHNRKYSYLSSGPVKLLIELEDCSSRDRNCCKSGVCALIIPCCNASPVFELGKHVFDFIALFVKGFAIPSKIDLSLSWRDAWLYIFGFENITELINAKAFVTDQCFSSKQYRADNLGSYVSRDLACRRRYNDLFAVCIENRMQFEVRALFVRPIWRGIFPLLPDCKLSSCRWAEQENEHQTLILASCINVITDNYDTALKTILIGQSFKYPLGCTALFFVSLFFRIKYLNKPSVCKSHILV